MTYDHEELKFFVNNVLVEPALTGIRGTVYPILFGKFFLLLGFKTLYCFLLKLIFVKC